MDFQIGLAVNVLQASILLLVLAFTAPDSLIRPSLLPLLGAITFYTLRLIPDGLFSKNQATFIAMNTIGIFFQYLDLGLLSRWFFSAGGPTSTLGGQRNVNASLATRKDLHELQTSTVWKRLQWALFAITTWRAPATPWEVKNVPPFNKREPKWVPTRARFLGNNVATIALCLLFTDLVFIKHDTESNVVNFGWQKVPLFTRLSEISLEEIAMRAVTLLSCWVAAYCSLQMVYSFLAIITVATNVSTVNVWPPLFGSIKGAYSVRQFWGHFWHQTIRQKCGSPAYYITYSLLRLRKGGIVGRYTFIFFAFAFSGLVHALEESCGGVPWHQSGSIRFFCMQSLGVLLEDVVQAIFHSLVAQRHRRWSRAVGYVWVVLWMTWTSAAWFYPKLQNSIGEKRVQMIPFRLSERFFS